MDFGGTIYKNGSRYRWKVRLPSTAKISQIPLKPQGAKFATTSQPLAEEIATQIWLAAPVMMIFDRVLSDEEVEQIYQSGLTAH